MCPLCNDHRVGDAVQSIYQDHYVGGLRGGAGATRSHGNANVRLGQCGSVVDAVADHEGWMHPLFGRYRVHLVGRHAIGEHRINVERGADGLCGIEPIAGDHHDTCGTGGAKCLHGAGGFAPELVAEKEGTDGPALDGDEDAKGGSPGGAAQRTH